MGQENLDQILDKLPVLKNPSTPSLRRLRKRLEQQVADPGTLPKMKSEKPAKPAATPKTEAPAKAYAPVAKPLPLHPLVAATKLVRVAHKHTGSVLKNDPDGLDIRVVTQFPRALDIMNRLFHKLIAKGFHVGLEGRWHKETVVRCEGTTYAVHIKEKYGIRPHQLTPDEKLAQRQGRSIRVPTRDFVGKGILELVAGHRCWLDDRHGRIEGCLDQVVGHMLEGVEVDRRERERREAEWRAARLEEERQAQMKRDIERLGFYGWLYDGMSDEDVAAIRATSVRAGVGLYEWLYRDAMTEAPDFGGRGLEDDLGQSK
ncbi:MAG: hypothetical protein NTW19_06180 [Planctomycetota bacterium]|nr:hypothetical protein [Planctomycetota bacterium]